MELNRDALVAVAAGAFFAVEVFQEGYGEFSASAGPVLKLGNAEALAFFRLDELLQGLESVAVVDEVGADADELTGAKQEG